MRDILKEIVKEQEENKKKGIILPQPHSGTAGSIKHTAINKTATQSLAGRESTISEEPSKHSDNKESKHHSQKNSNIKIMEGTSNVESELEDTHRS